MLCGEPRRSASAAKNIASQKIRQEAVEDEDEDVRTGAVGIGDDTGMEPEP